MYWSSPKNTDPPNLEHFHTYVLVTTSHYKLLPDKLIWVWVDLPANIPTYYLQCQFSGKPFPPLNYPRNLAGFVKYSFVNCDITLPGYKYLNTFIVCPCDINPTETLYLYVPHIYVHIHLHFLTTSNYKIPTDFVI